MLSKEEYKNKKIKEYYKNKSKDKKIISAYYDKREEDPINKLINSLSKRAYKYYKENDLKREIKYSEILCCDKNILKVYIERQFEGNMNYENYGEWEIDHIKPVSLCDSNNIESIKEIFNYKNLRPLWKSDNRHKGAKYSESLDAQQK